MKNYLKWCFLDYLLPSEYSLKLINNEKNTWKNHETSVEFSYGLMDSNNVPQAMEHNLFATGPGTQLIMFHTSWNTINYVLQELEHNLCPTGPEAQLIICHRLWNTTFFLPQALEQRVRHADNQRAQFVELIQVSNDKLKVQSVIDFT